MRNTQKRLSAVITFILALAMVLGTILPASASVASGVSTLPVTGYASEDSVADAPGGASEPEIVDVGWMSIVYGTYEDGSKDYINVILKPTKAEILALSKGEIKAIFRGAIDAVKTVTIERLKKAFKDGFNGTTGSVTVEDVIALCSAVEPLGEIPSNYKDLWNTLLDSYVQKEYGKTEGGELDYNKFFNDLVAEDNSAAVESFTTHVKDLVEIAVAAGAIDKEDLPSIETAEEITKVKDAVEKVVKETVDEFVDKGLVNEDIKVKVEEKLESTEDGNILDTIVKEYEDVKVQIEEKAPELSLTAVAKQLIGVTIDGMDLFNGKPVDLDINTATVKALIKSIPNFYEISNMEDLSIGWEIGVQTGFGNILFDLTFSLETYEDIVRRVAAIIADTIDVSYKNGKLTVDVELPELVSDLLLKVCEYKGDNAKLNAIKAKAFKLFSVTYGDITDEGGYYDRLKAYVANLEDSLTVDDIIALLEEYKGYVDKLLDTKYADYANKLISILYGKVVDEIPTSVTGKVGIDSLPESIPSDITADMIINKLKEHKNLLEKGLDYAFKASGYAFKLADYALDFVDGKFGDRFDDNNFVNSFYKGEGTFGASIGIHTTKNEVWEMVLVAYEKIINKLPDRFWELTDSAFDKIRDRLPEALQGLDADTLKNLEKYINLVFGFINIENIDLDIEVNVVAPGISKIDYVIGEGEDAKVVTGLLPEGATIATFIDIVKYHGRAILGWVDAEGNPVTKMPASDTTVYADLDDSAPYLLLDAEGNEVAGLEFVYDGNARTLVVAVNPDGPVAGQAASIKWYKADGTLVSEGATLSVQYLADSGEYYFVADLPDSSDFVPNVYTSELFAVNVKAEFTADDVDVALGVFDKAGNSVDASAAIKFSDDSAYKLVASVSGTPAYIVLSYQWYKDGVAIAGATSSELALANEEGTASYYCVVTASYANGVDADIIVNSAPIEVTLVKAEEVIDAADVWADFSAEYGVTLDAVKAGLIKADYAEKVAVEVYTDEACTTVLAADPAAGTYYAKVTAKEGYALTGTATKSFEISKKAIDASTIWNSGVVSQGYKASAYTKDEIQSLMIADATYITTGVLEFSVAGDAINAGDYTASLVVKNENYDLNGDDEKIFTITPATLNVDYIGFVNIIEKYSASNTAFTKAEVEALLNANYKTTDAQGNEVVGILEDDNVVFTFAIKDESFNVTVPVSEASVVVSITLSGDAAANYRLSNDERGVNYTFERGDLLAEGVTVESVVHYYDFIFGNGIKVPTSRVLRYNGADYTVYAKLLDASGNEVVLPEGITLAASYEMAVDGDYVPVTVLHDAGEYVLSFNLAMEGVADYKTYYKPLELSAFNTLLNDVAYEIVYTAGVQVDNIFHIDGFEDYEFEDSNITSNFVADGGRLKFGDVWYKLLAVHDINFSKIDGSAGDFNALIAGKGVLVTFDLTAEMAGKTLAIVHINSDGAINSKVDSIHVGSKTVSFIANEFSAYAIVEADSAYVPPVTPDGPGGDTPGGDEPGTDTPGTDTPGGDEPGSDTPATEPDNSIWLFIGLGVALLLVLAIVLAIIINRSKKRKEIERYNAVNNVDLYDDLKKLEWKAEEVVRLNAEEPESEAIDDSTIQLKARTAANQNVTVTEKPAPASALAIAADEKDLGNDNRPLTNKERKNRNKVKNLKLDAPKATEMTVTESPAAEPVESSEPIINIRPITERVITESAGDKVSVVSVDAPSEVVAKAPIKPVSDKVDAIVTEKKDNEVVGADVATPVPVTTPIATAEPAEREYDTYVAEKAQGAVVGQAAEAPIASAERASDAFVTETAEGDLVGKATEAKNAPAEKAYDAFVTESAQGEVAGVAPVKAAPAADRAYDAYVSESAQGEAAGVAPVAEAPVAERAYDAFVTESQEGAVEGVAPVAAPVAAPAEREYDSSVIETAEGAVEGVAPVAEAPVAAPAEREYDSYVVETAAGTVEGVAPVAPIEEAAAEREYDSSVIETAAGAIEGQDAVAPVEYAAADREYDSSVVETAEGAVEGAAPVAAADEYVPAEREYDSYVTETAEGAVEGAAPVAAADEYVSADREYESYVTESREGAVEDEAPVAAAQEAPAADREYDSYVTEDAIGEVLGATPAVIPVFVPGDRAYDSYVTENAAEEVAAEAPVSDVAAAPAERAYDSYVTEKPESAVSGVVAEEAPAAAPKDRDYETYVIEKPDGSKVRVVASEAEAPVAVADGSYDASVTEVPSGAVAAEEQLVAPIVEEAAEEAPAAVAERPYETYVTETPAEGVQDASVTEAPGAEVVAEAPVAEAAPAERTYEASIVESPDEIGEEAEPVAPIEAVPAEREYDAYVTEAPAESVAGEAPIYETAVAEAPVSQVVTESAPAAPAEREFESYVTEKPAEAVAEEAPVSAEAPAAAAESEVYADPSARQYDAYVTEKPAEQVGAEAPAEAAPVEEIAEEPAVAAPVDSVSGAFVTEGAEGDVIDEGAIEEEIPVAPIEKDYDAYVTEKAVIDEEAPAAEVVAPEAPAEPEYDAYITEKGAEEVAYEAPVTEQVAEEVVADAPVADTYEGYLTETEGAEIADEEPVSAPVYDEPVVEEAPVAEEVIEAADREYDAVVVESEEAEPLTVEYGEAPVVLASDEIPESAESVAYFTETPDNELVGVVESEAPVAEAYDEAPVYEAPVTEEYAEAPVSEAPVAEAYSEAPVYAEPVEEYAETESTSEEVTEVVEVESYDEAPIEPVAGYDGMAADMDAASENVAVVYDVGAPVAPISGYASEEEGTDEEPAEQTVEAVVEEAPVAEPVTDVAPEYVSVVESAPEAPIEAVEAEPVADNVEVVEGELVAPIGEIEEDTVAAPAEEVVEEAVEEAPEAVQEPAPVAEPEYPELVLPEFEPEAEPVADFSAADTLADVEIVEPAFEAVEEAPVEEVVEEAPVEEVVEEAPAEEVVEEAPVEEVVEEAPVEEVVEEAPVEEVVEEAPVEEVVEEAPVEEVVEEAPVEEVVEEAPVEEVVEEAPVEEVVEEAPVEEVVEEAPVEEVVEEAPVEEVVEEAPVEAAPVVLPELGENEGTRLINGEIVLVHYRSSFTSRLIQADPEVQDYYTILKNVLLSYKGVKARSSWNIESFNKGRIQCAKLNIKGRTIALYLALDPKEYEESKYHFTDVSGKPKFDKVPMLIKVRSDRALKYAIELIEEMMSKLGMVQGEIPNVDYHMPYESTEDLVAKDLVKVILPAGMSLDENANVVKVNVGELIENAKAEAADEEAPVEEVVEEAPAEEVVEEAPVEEVVEEAPVEEVIEEAPVEEVVEEAPAEEVVEEAPVEEIVEEAPVEEVVEEAPVEEVVEEAPVEEVVEEAPVEEVVEEAPVEEVVEEAPVEEVVEEAPVEEVVEEVPVEEVVEEAPVEEVVEEAPVEEVVEEAPAEEVVEEAPVEEVVEEAPVEEVVEEAPVEEAPVEEVVEEAPVEEVDDMATPDEEGRVHVDASHADELVSDEEAEASIEVIKSTKKASGKMVEINIDAICENFEDGETVDLDALKKKKLVPASAGRLKVLARGIMTKNNLIVIADKFSLQAVKMITLAGGHAEQNK